MYLGATKLKNAVTHNEVKQINYYIVDRRRKIFFSKKTDNFTNGVNTFRRVYVFVHIYCVASEDSGGRWIFSELLKQDDDVL